MAKPVKKKVSGKEETKKVKWVKVSTGKMDVWKPKREGEAIEGVLLSVSQGQFGKIIKVKTPEGKVLALPSHKVLLSQFEEGNFAPGSSIRVECTSVGSETPGDYYNYDVMKDENQVPF